jgi:hypothetical protein
MFRRILRVKLKVLIVLAVIGALVLIAKKLMGGLGPEPGSELAPREWPSLVPDPPAAPSEMAAPDDADTTVSANGNGSAPTEAVDEGADAAD